MADEADFGANATPTLQQLASFHADELFDVKRLQRIENVVTDATSKGLTQAKAAEYAAAKYLAELLGKFLETVESQVEPVMGPFLAKLASHLVGQELSTSDLRRSAAGGGEGAIGDAMAKIAFGMLAPPAGELVPGREGAEKFVKTMSQLVFNGWFEATAFEMLATLFPDLDSFESVAELPHELINSLGLGRLARTALRPLAHLLIATPLDWELSKAHRPKLLSEGEILKAFNRGDYAGADASEELARLGYSDRRQDMLLKSAQKRLSLDDALLLTREAGYSPAFVVENLRHEGYDESAAQLAMLAATSRRLAAIHDDSAAAVRAAYVDRRISDAELSQFFSAIYLDDAELAAHEVAARTMRDCNTRRLAPSEARACVAAGVLPIASYRDALRVAGYDEESVLALELLLETELHEKADIDKLRKEKLADAAAAKKVAEEERAKKQAELDEQRQLAKRGPISELIRAAVRGLIPFARVQEVLAAQYDGDTVQIYLADMEEQRQAYLDEQAKADAATKRATIRHIDVGALQSAVLEGVLTLAQFRRALAPLGFTSADADVLTATLEARAADVADAKAKQLAAQQAASRRSIDLGRFEDLVRRGARSFADYDALLASLGFEDGARAAMVDLLRLKVVDDQQARDARAAAAANPPSHGLTLEQARRAVVLGLSDENGFQRYLVDNHFTADAQSVLLAELRRDVADAEAARRKRDEAPAARGPVAVPLSTLARAARLGIILPTAYQQRLLDAGYTADDVALELELLTTEIADVQAARTEQATVDATAPPTPLSLAQLAAAVKAGVRPLADYQALALEKGVGHDDVTTLVRVLADELAATQAAAARRGELADAIDPKGVSLASLAGQVRAGTATLGDYRGALVGLGLDPIDVDLLTALLGDELAGGPFGRAA